MSRLCRPIIFSIDGDATFEANFVLATLAVDLLPSSQCSSSQQLSTPGTTRLQPRHPPHAATSARSVHLCLHVTKLHHPQQNRNVCSCLDYRIALYSVCFIFVIFHSFSVIIAIVLLLLILLFCLFYYFYWFLLLRVFVRIFVVDLVGLRRLEQAELVNLQQSQLIGAHNHCVTLRDQPIWTVV